MRLAGTVDTVYFTVVLSVNIAMHAQSTHSVIHSTVSQRKQHFPSIVGNPVGLLQ